MDQYHGQGGTYLLDPNTGERVLIERTEPIALDQPTPLTRVRSRSERGRFRADDPTTPDVDEAWQ